jgi:hypothetical protein
MWVVGGGALHTEPTSILYLIMKPKMGAWHCCNSLCTASSSTQKKQTQKKPKANNHETKAVGKKNSVTYLDKANFAL